MASRRCAYSTTRGRSTGGPAGRRPLEHVLHDVEQVAPRRPPRTSPRRGLGSGSAGSSVIGVGLGVGLERDLEVVGSGSSGGDARVGAQPVGAVGSAARISGAVSADGVGTARRLGRLGCGRVARRRAAARLGRRGRAASRRASAAAGGGGSGRPAGSAANAPRTALRRRASSPAAAGGAPRVLGRRRPSGVVGARQEAARRRRTPRSRCSTGRRGPPSARTDGAARCCCCTSAARREATSWRPWCTFSTRFRIAMALATKPSAANSSASPISTGTASSPRPAWTSRSASCSRTCTPGARRPSSWPRRISIIRARFFRAISSLIGTSTGVFSQSMGMAVGGKVPRHCRSPVKRRRDRGTRPGTRGVCWSR